MKILKKIANLLGPGLITGVADDDPSGIATYSQTGAQFGYAQLYMALFMLPLMMAVQEACARIGAVKGRGLVEVINRNYSKMIVFPVVLLIGIANTINIGADIGAMASATELMLPIPFYFLIVMFCIVILALEIFLCYETYVNILKWLCLFIFAYPITIIVVQAPWQTILKATFIPSFEFSFQYIFIITGLLGTTISPYLFVWQSAQVVEEQHKNHVKKKNNSEPKISEKDIRNIRLDNAIGMFFSQFTCWSIIVVTATVLHTHGLTDIKTAADAAKALEPFAGDFAKYIFALGIVGLGFIAVPVLAGSVAYAVAEVMGWPGSLDYKFKRAKCFYLIIIIATVIGLAFNFLEINPMKALIYAAVINGVVAVPLIFLIGIIGNNKKIMGDKKNGALSNIFIAITFIGMTAAGIAMFVSFFKG